MIDENLIKQVKDFIDRLDTEVIATMVKKWEFDYSKNPSSSLKISIDVANEVLMER